jgi:glycerol-3-phosphate O-acyltransferase
VTPDRIRQAVIARPDVRRFIDGEDAAAHPGGRERIDNYLDELRTTQRHSFYRALKHPLYPILRKITRVAEGLPRLTRTLEEGRVVYVSNHKSHLDYLIEPLILEDHNLRPPIIAAGINLFGGALGLLHKHVTGAIPIRRSARDPAYLVTLQAYVAELLRYHDLFFYLEGGRSYSGELKSAKTGLFHAVVMAEVPVQIVPVAVAYDLVLEDSILARQGTKRRQRPFTRELAEMVGTAVGYRSRAFVTWRRPRGSASGSCTRCCQPRWWPTCCGRPCRLRSSPIGWARSWGR